MRLDFSLPPGETSETITVTEEVPMLNITSSTLGGTLSNKQIAIGLPSSRALGFLQSRTTK